MPAAPGHAGRAVLSSRAVPQVNRRGTEIIMPANLTELAKKNGGVFPSELVFRTIDGRQPVRGHGGPDMPVWGDAFAKSREAGDADRAKAMIQSLVDHLESIQLRPTHDQ